VTVCQFFWVVIVCLFFWDVTPCQFFFVVRLSILLGCQSEYSSVLLRCVSSSGKRRCAHYFTMFCCVCSSGLLCRVNSSGILRRFNW
jgi:hypothetical protein